MEPGSSEAWVRGCNCTRRYGPNVPPRINPECPMHGRVTEPKRSVIEGDMREVLAVWPDETIDAIVTDPAYRVISGGNKVPEAPKGMLSKNDGKVFSQNDIKPEEYAHLLFRVLKSPGHAWVMCNEHNRRKMEDAFLDAGFQTHFLGAWIKNNVTPNRWGMKNAELVFLFRKGPARTLYTPSLKQFERCDNILGNKRHETEKPVDLMRRYVEASSKPGDTVMDPFCGSGPVGEVCRDTGRGFVGIEIDPKYVEIAKGRI